MNIGEKFKHVSRLSIYKIIDLVLLEVKGRVEPGVVYVKEEEPETKYCRSIRSFKSNFNKVRYGCN